MNYKTLGRTGIQVSELCFGTMTFGDSADKAESQALYSRCRDAGINFFDCANVYAGGKSEKILGQLMADHRDEVVITSKFFYGVETEDDIQGGSRRNIMLSVEGSLRRLNTDRIDLYFMHQFDPRTPLETTLRALDDLVKQGKILHIGASNYAAWQVVKALGISAEKGLERFECIQPMYNLAKRQAEVEILPMAISEQVGVIPYNPLGGGLLTGKYGISRRPASGRLLENDMYSKRYGDSYVFEVAERFTQFSAENGFDPVALAVAWVGSHPAVTAPILGARNVDQLEGSLASLSIDMTPELRDQVSSLSAEPPPAHDRSETRLK